MKKQNYDIVDFHSHILPRADHGSSSVEMSLSQLEYAKDNGVKRVIVTPHFYPNIHYVDAFLEKRRAAYERLLSSIPEGMPEIRLGAEVLICENIHNIEELDSLCVEGTKTLLLELPKENLGFDFTSTVLELEDKGYSVVLAHADRYHFSDVQRLVDVGAKVQLNASALVSVFTKPAYRKWITDRTLVAIGSDIHLDDKKAYKNFRKAIKKLGSYAEYIEKCSKEYWI